MNCKDCSHYKFESGPADYCPASYGVMYCELLHGQTRAFSEDEVNAIKKAGSPENCPLKKESENVTN